MYNLAKLLAEEPEKLEKLGLTFLKLLVTIFAGCSLFEFKITISTFFENPIPEDFTVSQFLYLLILLVITWFVIWAIFADLLLGELLIWLLSKIGNKKYMFIEVLEVLNVVKKKGKFLTPGKNIISFNEMLNTFYEDNINAIVKSKSRTEQYFVVSAVIYFTLLLAKDITLGYAFKWIGGIMVTNFLLGSVTYNIVLSYFNENLDEMKKEFSRLAFAQMVLNVLNQNQFIKSNFEIKGRWNKIRLERKSDENWLPKEIYVAPFYYWNDSLTQEILNFKFEKAGNNDSYSHEKWNYYRVVICNVILDEKIVQKIKKQPMLVYLQCINEEQIYRNFEVFLFKVTAGRYSNSWSAD